MSGFGAPQSRFISPTNDFNRSGGEGTVNVNVQPNMNELSNRTTQRIFQVASEEPESSEIILSSRYKISGTPFNFVSNLGSPLFRGRLLQLRNTIMPGIPNINPNNNVLRIQMVRYDNLNPAWNPVNLVVTLPVGYYQETNLGNQFANQLTDAVKSQMPGQVWDEENFIQSVDDYYCIGDYNSLKGIFEFNIVIRSITVVKPSTGTVTSITRAYLFNFWLDNSCSFARFGVNVAQFPTAPPQPTLPLIGNNNQTLQWSVPSPPALAINGTGLQSLFGPQFIYSRYVTVTSEALSLYTFGSSRVDLSADTTGGGGELEGQGLGGGGGKIIGTISTAKYRNPNYSFLGQNIVTSVDAPVLGIRNPQLKLNEFVDLQVSDEFGFPLDSAFPTDNVAGPTFAFMVSY